MEDHFFPSVKNKSTDIVPSWFKKIIKDFGYRKNSQKKKKDTVKAGHQSVSCSKFQKVTSIRGPSRKLWSLHCKLGEPKVGVAASTHLILQSTSSPLTSSFTCSFISRLWPAMPERRPLHRTRQVLLRQGLLRAHVRQEDTRRPVDEQQGQQPLWLILPESKWSVNWVLNNVYCCVERCAIIAGHCLIGEHRYPLRELSLKLPYNF